MSSSFVPIGCKNYSIISDGIRPRGTAEDLRTRREPTGPLVLSVLS